MAGAGTEAPTLAPFGRRAGVRRAAEIGHLLPANAEPETLAACTQFICYRRAAKARAALLMVSPGREARQPYEP
jgi:hypothetical protein